MSTESKKSRKIFSKKDVHSRFFDHQHTDGGGITEGIAILRCDENGWCIGAEFNATGIKQPFLNLWSGCLSPAREMTKDQIKLAEEARKLTKKP